MFGMRKMSERRSEPPLYTVSASLDEETGRWSATSEQIQGLFIEEDSFEELKQSLIELVPQLLELNCPDHPGGEVGIVLNTSHPFWIHQLAAE